jgi:hypothetical protein
VNIHRTLRHEAKDFTIHCLAWINSMQDRSAA